MITVHSIPEMVHQALKAAIKFLRGELTDWPSGFEAEGVECHLATFYTDATCTSEKLHLIFVREKGEPRRRRMDVMVAKGGEQQRIGDSRKLRKVTRLLRLHERKRIYFADTVTPAAINAACALVCLYLVQNTFVSLEENQSVWNCLRSYLERFKGAKQVGAAAVLAELHAHYQLPEDYRAWALYVSKTSRGLAATEKRQERSYVISDPAGTKQHFMVPAVANRLGMPTRSLYHLVAQGAVHTKEVTAGGRRYQTIPDTEIERLEREWQRKRLRKVLIAAWAVKQGIPPASARRWVERQEKKGLGLKEMGEKVGHDWLEKVVRSLSQDSRA